MEESTTYQYILEKGGLKEAKRMILRMGVIRFGGPPGEAIKAQLEAIDDLELLERLGEQLLTVNSWEELLPES